MYPSPSCPHDCEESRRYSFKTLVGNWNEELFLHEYRIKKSLDKFSNSTALLQYTETMLDYYLGKVQLQTTCDIMKFGAVIQLCAVRFPNPFPRYAGLPMVVSLHLNPSLLRETQTFSEECDLSVAPSIMPCRRNSFVISSADAKDRKGEDLCYGDSFNIRLVEPDECGTPLVLYSSLKSMNLQSKRKTTEYFKNSEINQSVGVCPRLDLIEDKNKCAPEIPQMHTYWKCLHVNPNMRYETLGTPIPSNQPIVIAHASTNKLLAAEATQSHTTFGQECGLSLATYETVHKIQKDQNVWILKISSNAD